MRDSARRESEMKFVAMQQVVSVLPIIALHPHGRRLAADQIRKLATHLSARLASALRFDSSIGFRYSRQVRQVARAIFYSYDLPTFSIDDHLMMHAIDYKCARSERESNLTRNHEPSSRLAQIR